MLKKTNTSRDFLAVLIGIAACVLIGSFCDLALSSAVFNIDSIFGMIFAGYGDMPMSICMFAAALILFMHPSKKIVLRVLQIIGAILCLLMSVPFMVVMPAVRDGLPMPVAIVVGIALIVCLSIFLPKGIRKMDHSSAVRLALTLVLVAYGSMMLVNMFKGTWARPRMRMISITDGAAFQPWWVIGCEAKDALMQLGVAAEEFKSFPSGHTCSAATALLLPYVARYSAKYTDKERTFFWIGVVWAVVVAFSRIIMGAHFLTDVSFGFLATLIVMYVCRKFIMKDL